MWKNQGMYQIPTYGSLIVTPKWSEFLSTNNDLMNIAFTEIVKARSQKQPEALGKIPGRLESLGRRGAQAEMSDTLLADVQQVNGDSLS